MLAFVIVLTATFIPDLLLVANLTTPNWPFPRLSEKL